MGKYLTPWDYPQRQINIIACLHLKAIFPKFPCLIFTIKMQCHAKCMSPRWPFTIRDKALVLTTGLLFSCCIFFPHFFYVLWDLDILQHASKEAGGPIVLRFSHLRAMVFCVCRERLWQAERERGWAGSHRKEPSLNTGPAPRKERGISVHRPRN